MNKAVHLKTFSSNELLLSEEDTELVLTFFFPKYEGRISSAVMDDNLRGFAQGLLVEAIDATYAMGYVEALFKALIAGILPTGRANATVKIIKTFAKEGSSHWFKHATVHDLIDVKIYEIVRKAINRNFDSILEGKLLGIASDAPPVSFVNYASVFCHSRYYWG